MPGRIRILRVASVFCLLFASYLMNVERALSGESTWTGWLGPDRNGWVADFQAPDRWADRLTSRWKVDVGTGYGSPLVIDGRVYQHARQDGDEVLWCLDAASGSVVWRQHIPVPFRAAGGGESHGTGPKSCPVIGGGRVFTFSITGNLAAWDARTGDPIWQRSYDAAYGGGHPNWGASASPIVDGNRVIVHFGTDDKGSLTALDTATGKEVWQQGRQGASYSSPLLVEMENVRQVVQWNHESIVGVESSSGALLWEYSFPHEGHNQNMPTPSFHKGRILLGGENRGLHCLVPRLVDGQWTVNRLWEQPAVALDMSSPVVNGDLLFGFSHYQKGQLFCLAVDSGKIIWQGKGRLAKNATFLSVPEYVLALLDSGQLQVFKVDEAEPRMVASWKVSSTSTWAPPVLLQDGVLIKDQETLVYWSFAKSASASSDK